MTKPKPFKNWSLLKNQAAMDVIFENKSRLLKMKVKDPKAKGLETDFVTDGYNKANLMAATEKGSSGSKKKPETCQEALGDTLKSYDSRFKMWSSRS